jgi:hypothetical protein
LLLFRTPVFLNDIAEVVVGNKPRLGIAGRDEQDDIVQGIVLMRRASKANRVKATLPAIMTSTENATMSARIRSEKAMMAFMDQARRARLQFTHQRAEGSISLIRRKKNCPQRGQRKLCL